ncbi:MAG: AAA family ATPase [Spirochaetes bacterium]|nr:AAA family ATPase [Spirochaetota bacterium]
MESFKLKFVVRQRNFPVPKTERSVAFLHADHWDDWGKFQTLFHLYFFDDTGIRHDIGSVKIGQFGLKGGGSISNKPGERYPQLPETFDMLNESFFSLGQDENYYEAIGKLSENTRKAICLGIRDVVFDKQLWEKSLDEEVMVESLLRFVDRKNVEEQFQRLLKGADRLIGFSFKYRFPKSRAMIGKIPEMVFNISPKSSPPTNIHVLIGKNGVGKTQTLNQMARAISGGTDDSDGFGEFRNSDSTTKDHSLFSSVLNVSFSAFDDFEIQIDSPVRPRKIRHNYVGLKQKGKDGKIYKAPKGPEALASEFSSSLEICQVGNRLGRWRDLIKILESDSIIKESGFSHIGDRLIHGGAFELTSASKIFGQLSSGHKIVLLAITKMVEIVNENTLILFDEPETHLHPPLLSAFIRALSELLSSRNGVAIVATHSPVVLQEVPQECVWILKRAGSEIDVERPRIQTFGENVGTITREVFGLEVSKSGFHKMLLHEVEALKSYEEIISHFENKLGGEAHAILLALLATRRES